MTASNPALGREEDVKDSLTPALADDALKAFLHDNSYPGYYTEHGEGFAETSFAYHAEALSRRGYSLINSHASRNRSGIYFGSDLRQLTAATVKENLTVQFPVSA